MNIKCRKEIRALMCVSCNPVWYLRCVWVGVLEQHVDQICWRGTSGSSDYCWQSSHRYWIINWLLDGICISIHVYTPPVHILTESAKANLKDGTYKRCKLQAFHPVLAASGTWHVTPWITLQTQARLGVMVPCNVQTKIQDKRCMFSHVCLI